MSNLFLGVKDLFTPLLSFAVGDSIIGSLVVFSIVLTVVGSTLHFLLART